MADNDAHQNSSPVASLPADSDLNVRLRQMIAGYQVTQAIHVAAVLGVADLLKEGPQSAAWLAEQTGSNEEALYRLLRSLESIGIFAEVEPRRFALTPLAELLRTDAPESVHAGAVMHGQDWFWRPWGRLLDSVKTGNPTFEAVVGKKFYELLQSDPEARAIALRAMTVASVPAAVSTYDFSRASLLVDVAGGDGTVLSAILLSQPQLSAVYLDRPSMLEVATRNLAAAGVKDRCQLVTGNFFESVPTGGDVYLVCQTLHNWDDPPAAQILATCRRAMTDGSTLVVVERILPRGHVSHGGPLIDLNMLVLMGGRERTEDEYEALLAKAGFRMTSARPAPYGNSFIEAEPV